MKNAVINYFEKLLSYSNIGHAFLIGNDKLDNLANELEEILSKYIFKSKIILFENADVYVIRPENGSISKNQILELHSKLTTTSQISNCKVYIIDECDTMNSYASNSLLKILEEPEDNIFAFLITKNIDNVISTIKSRCQLIFTSSIIKENRIYNNVDEEFVTIVLSFVDLIERYGSTAIAHVSEISSKIMEKEYLKNVLSVVEYFYRDCLSVLLDMNLEYFYDDVDKVKEVVKQNDIDKIINKLQVISKNIVDLDYNVNIMLFIDNLMIELGGNND